MYRLSRLRALDSSCSELVRRVASRAPALSRGTPLDTLRAFDRPPAKKGSACRLTCWRARTGHFIRLQPELSVSRDGPASL